MARIGKQDFINKIAEKTGITKREASKVFDASLEIIEEEVRAGNDIVIPGFGSIKVQSVKARVGRNIKTGEELTIPAHRRVKFTPGKILKTAADET
jgi:DNA-binding protein HU-beta